MNVTTADRITGREHPPHLRCPCPFDATYHSYSCPVLLWVTLNPPPRKVCTACNGRGSTA